MAPRHRFFGWVCGSTAVESQREARLVDPEKIATELMALIAENKKWLRREGLFRVPGNASKIADAQRILEDGLPLDDILDDTNDEACEVVASLLRKWLPRAISSLDSDSARHMFEFLALVADDAEFNKMPASNLATIFAPLFCDLEPSADFVRTVLTPAIADFTQRIIHAQKDPEFQLPETPPSPRNQRKNSLDWTSDCDDFGDHDDDDEEKKETFIVDDNFDDAPASFLGFSCGVCVAGDTA